MAKGKFKGKPTGQRTFSSKEELEAGTSADRPKTFSKKKQEVSNRREESIEEESDEEVEKTKHKGTAGLIDIENPNLVKPMSIKAKDVVGLGKGAMRASSSSGVACATAAWGVVILLAVLASVPSTSAAAEASVPSTSAPTSVASTSAAAEASVPSTSAPTSVASTSAAAEASVPSTSAPTSVASTSAAVEKGCNATELATAIVKACIKGSVSEPLTSCCSFILPMVDMVDCLCMVVDEPQIADSSTTSKDLFGLYLSCGGKRHSGDKPYESCDDFIETSAPSLPVPASPPPPPSSKEMNSPTDHRSFKIEVSTDAGVWVTALLTFIGMAYAAYEWITRGTTAAPASSGGTPGTNDNKNGQGGTNGASRLPPVRVEELV